MSGTNNGNTSEQKPASLASFSYVGVFVLFVGLFPCSKKCYQELASNLFNVPVGGVSSGPPDPLLGQFKTDQEPNKHVRCGLTIPKRKGSAGPNMGEVGKAQGELRDPEACVGPFGFFLGWLEPPSSPGLHSHL